MSLDNSTPRLNWSDVSGMYYIDKLPQNYKSIRNIDWSEATSTIRECIKGSSKDDLKIDSNLIVQLTNKFGIWVQGCKFDLSPHKFGRFAQRDLNQATYLLLYQLIEWEKEISSLEGLFYAKYPLDTSKRTLAFTIASTAMSISYHFGPRMDWYEDWMIEARIGINWYLESLGIDSIKSKEITEGIFFDDNLSLAWVPEKEDLERVLTEFGKRVEAYFSKVCE